MGKCTWILLIVLLFVTQNQVSAKGKIYFIEQHNFEQNKYINYELDISEKSEIAGLTVTIRYDTKQLKLVESNAGETLQTTMNKINNKVDGTVIITAISTDEITEKGSILNLKFELLNDLKEYIDIQCCIDECINQNCDEIPNTITSEKIKNPLYKPAESSEEVAEENQESMNAVLSEEKVENMQKNEVDKIENDKVGNDEKKQEDSSQTEGAIKTEINKKENESKNTYLFTFSVLGGVAILILSFMIARRRRK